MSLLYGERKTQWKWEGPKVSLLHLKCTVSAIQSAEEVDKVLEDPLAYSIFLAGKTASGKHACFLLTSPIPGMVVLPLSDRDIANHMLKTIFPGEKLASIDKVMDNVKYAIGCIARLDAVPDNASSVIAKAITFKDVPTNKPDLKLNMAVTIGGLGVFEKEMTLGYVADIALRFVDSSSSSS